MTKILILEDDDFIRQQLAGILQEKGYSVVEAASVGQFNKIYEQEEAAIDVVLLDVYPVSYTHLTLPTNSRV